MIVLLTVEMSGETQREDLSRGNGLTADYLLIAGRIIEDDQHAIEAEIANPAGGEFLPVSAQPTRQIDCDTPVGAPLRLPVGPGSLNAFLLYAFVAVDVEGFR